MKKKYSDNQLIEAVKKSTSYLEVTKNLGLKRPGNFYSLKNNIQRLKIDTSHFLTAKERYEKISKSKKFLKDEEIFSENSSVYYGYVKSLVLKRNLIPYSCNICGISSWQNTSLVLHLDHINGVRKDNRLENLRFLCPNCHSQTPTYCGRNNKTSGKKFCSCGISIYKHSTKCKPCSNKSRKDKNTKISWPSNEELIKLVKEHSFTDLSKILGVTDNAIRKRLRVRNIEY